MDSESVAGIAIGSSVGTIFLIALAVAVYNSYAPAAYPAGPSTGSVLNKLGLFNWFQILYYFLPYGLFLFGIIYDGLGRSIKFFPAGFIGLATVYLNSAISYFANGVSLTDSDVCGLPGMSKWGSNIAPQNIVFTTTVLSYIAAYVSANQSSSAYSGIAWSGVGIAFVIQSIAYLVNNCSTSRPGGELWKWAPYWILPPLYALLGGMLVGGSSGALVASYVGTGSGSSSGAGSGTSVGALQQLGSSASSTPGVGKCSPTSGGDDDAFVCEAYKNGELVTSTIVG